MVYTERHVKTKQHCKYLTSVIFKNALCKATITHFELHATRAQWVCLEAKNSAL